MVSVGGTLFLRKNRAQIRQRIFPIPPFKILIRSACEGIWFLTENTWSKANDYIKGRGLCLPSGECPHSREIFKTFVVHDYLDRVAWGLDDNGWREGI
jgi:hypothetical protein